MSHVVSKFQSVKYKKDFEAEEQILMARHLLY